MLFLPKCLSFDFPGLQRKRCFSTGKCLCLGMPVKISFTTLAVLLPLQFYYPWPLLGHLNRWHITKLLPHFSLSSTYFVWLCVCTVHGEYHALSYFAVVPRRPCPCSVTAVTLEQWHTSPGKVLHEFSRGRFIPIISNDGPKSENQANIWN